MRFIRPGLPDPRDLYDPKFFELGRSPDTQPISDADWAALRAYVAAPKRATVHDRFGRGIMLAFFSAIFSVVPIALGAMLGGLHGAGIGLMLALGLGAISVTAGVANNSPL